MALPIARRKTIAKDTTGDIPKLKGRNIQRTDEKNSVWQTNYEMKTYTNFTLDATDFTHNVHEYAFQRGRMKTFTAASINLRYCICNKNCDVSWDYSRGVIPGLYQSSSRLLDK